MKKGEIYEGIIEKVEFPNKGYVNIDGEKVIVKNGIPGQKVRFMINKKRSGRAEGRLLEVLEKSPLEIRKPVCKIFPACGGCMYQTMSYEEQLKMKETQVKGLLQDAVGADVDLYWEGIHGSPIEFGYRNKMEFSFGDEYKGGPLSLGLHKKGSTYDVLTAADCKLVHPDMTAILSCVRDFFTELGAVHYKKMQHTGYLRHLLLRRGVTSGEILVHVITTSQAEYDYAPLVSRLLALPLEGKIVGIMHIINDSLSDVVRSDETRLLYGQDYFYETLLGLRFKISTFSFFQPNSLAAEVLYAIVRDYIGDTKEKEVFDLYSGTGTIAQLLASVAKEVIGVEIVEEAVEAAKVNAALNGLTNCRFIAGDVLKVLDDITEKPDMIILDPPRDGIHPKALPKILAYGVENIVYISCKPTSLARDLPAFLAAGYEIRRSCSVDQFCETVHVETVVLLSQQKPDDTIEIDLDLDELDATSAELKATYQEIKDYVLKEFGLKVSSLYISQVKRKCGIEVGENYNLPKSENARVPQCPKEKEEAIKAALEYFAMI
ncbi:23S rRNA (uracil(1939)-C(5))-methyltransferase RlmD [Blautia glucerasea]|uniref:23S rRNA (uracil(1939)-C(5))-methyltransferase RlmD n=1 Tax=Blautia glucerasea TaxID=536633 RepID=UPI001D002FC6|nr:23S rRNA (uracil(1939)-C(5))-methyltransferase RlmD [Blautia glucerasea]MCB5385618.1 23S rRNA (uracil(1939)-C(5))-methyltransferase RlmD [Blautia glucerasea]